VAFPIGGGVNVALTDSIHVYGEGYVAPEGLNNSVKNYVEANGGVSWTPITPVTLKVGYRHVSVDGKDGRPGHTLIDGAYVGGGVSLTLLNGCALLRARGADRSRASDGLRF
jgi:opacity protein-like surface antigen